VNKRLLVLTHADIVDHTKTPPVPEKVLVDVELIGMAWRMPLKGGTAVSLVGGAAVLVKETPEFVMDSKMKYLEGNKPKKKEEK
jgi:hypothetical protein